MTAIAQHAADHDMQAYEPAAYLNLGRDYSDQGELTDESLAILDGPAEMIDEIAGYLTSWGVPYSLSKQAVTVGTITATADRTVRGVLLEDDGEYMGVTPAAGDAAALLAFQVARDAWDAGYAGDFGVLADDDSIEVTMTVSGEDVSILLAERDDSRFTAVSHPLFREQVTMSDLRAVLESAELAYGNPGEAWLALCNAADFKFDDWMTLVEYFHRQARFDLGERLTEVSTSESDNAALVGDASSDFPNRVTDAGGTIDVACWSHADVAAAVLYTLS